MVCFAAASEQSPTGCERGIRLAALGAPKGTPPDPRYRVPYADPKPRLTPHLFRRHLMSETQGKKIGDKNE